MSEIQHASVRKPARVTLRMTPQLHDALVASAAEAGCSFNAFAVQVLAAAAGRRTRFRGTADTGPTRDEALGELRDLDRLENGYPVPYKERDRRTHARPLWVAAMEKTMGWEELGPTIRRIDRDAPWLYVEWMMSEE